MTVKSFVISMTSFPETTALKFLNIETVWRLHFGNCTFMISKCRTILKDITMPVWMIKNCKLFSKWETIFYVMPVKKDSEAQQAGAEQRCLIL